jgi:hypothetical protein
MDARDDDGPAGAPSPVRQAVTTAARTEDALRELCHGLAQPDPSLVLLFCSPEYETPGFARGAAEAFPGAVVVGCTTAGEITPRGYIDNSVAGISFARPAFDAVAARIGPLREAEPAACGPLAQRLRAELEARHPAADGAARNLFALTFFDGLAGREESVMSWVGGALSDIPVFGASAGDGLTFRRTRVLSEGAFHGDSAVLTLVATDHPIRPFRHQHFVSSARKLVVTGADPARRVVTEINAEPAVDEYARAIGYEVDQLTPMVFATHPLVVRLGGAEYVRSIQQANPDGSLTFYGAIDEGLVLTLAQGLDLCESLEALFRELRAEVGEPEAVLGFDCVLRRLEAEHDQTKPRVSRLLQANRVLGFSTFGEQFGSMHVNQTFTGVAIGRPVPTEAAP